MIYIWSKCFRNKTFTLVLRSTVFLFFFPYCRAGFTLSKKYSPKLLFGGVLLVNTSGIDSWTTAFWCKGNSCHIIIQCNTHGASNGCVTIIVSRSWLETGWFTLHEDEWLTEDVVAGWGVSLKDVSISGLAAIVADVEGLLSLLFLLIVSSSKFILLKLKSDLTNVYF